MEGSNKEKNQVDIALEEQRKESEARAILQDLERLVTTPAERKRRWVWELIQNAKDSVVTPNSIEKVNIIFHLTNQKLTFSHDGRPFELKHLLALVRRTSTKSYNNENGNTGKFGTGFITTHVLNRRVNISGLLENDLGVRDFSLLVDRTSETLEGLQDELDKVFIRINEIYEKTPQEVEAKSFTKYEYDLDDDAYKLASESLDELKRNLPFMLLVNPSINSVQIIDDRRKESKRYQVSENLQLGPGVSFSQLITNKIGDDQRERGLLHYTEGHLTIAVPVERVDNDITWRIVAIGSQARLYREFPLIGTGQWRIPFFLQSTSFIPAEERDGVRTLKDNESKPDVTADQNRKIFIDYSKAVITFFKNLQACPVDKLFLLAESGLPSERTEYTSTEWFIDYLQKPLRQFFLSQNLVKTVAGEIVPIDKARFPEQFDDHDINESYYLIAERLYRKQFPTKDDFQDWQRIISQSEFNWGANLINSPQNLVEDLNKHDGLKALELDGSDSVEHWLNRLISFLSKIGNSDLGENYQLYPNQEGSLSKKQDVRIDPPLNDTIKGVGAKLGIPVLRQLLAKQIDHRDGIGTFDSKAFFNGINKIIGDLVPASTKSVEYMAVFELVSLFNDSNAKERTKWYLLVKQLLPQIVREKQVVYDMAEFNFGSAELASIKYVCWLIQESKNFTAFNSMYFQGEGSTAYEWLNDFIDVLFRNQDYEELIRKYSIVPMQNGLFRKLESEIFREDRNCFFDQLFKDIYTEFANKGDVKTFLIDKKITNESLPWKTVKSITDEIDYLFSSPNIEKHVEPEGDLNSLFHQLNDWFSENENEGVALFPHFSRHRPILYIKAFGPEVSKMVITIHKLQKPIDEIQALVNLNMKSEELEQLVKASLLAGGTEKLVAVANEIAENAKNVEWRKKVGTAAEKAFVEALKDVSVYNLEKPDEGYDFEIHFNNVSPYLVEIKSTVQSRESIKMSGLQGKTATENINRYALCVIAREQHDVDVNKDYFIANAKFVTDIGEVVQSKVYAMEEGLDYIDQYRGGEIEVLLDNKQYSVYVGKNTWKEAIGFNEFVSKLRGYFEQVDITTN